MNAEQALYALLIVSPHELDHSLDELHDHSQFGVLLHSGHQVEGLIDVPLMDPNHQQ